MTDLLWTPETRARVLPRRSHGAREPLPRGSAARAQLDAIYKLRRASITKGVAHAPDDLRAQQQKAIAYLDHEGPIHAVSAAAAAILVQTGLPDDLGTTNEKLSRAIVDAWIAEGGAAFAVLACVSTTAFTARRHPTDEASVLVALRQTTDGVAKIERRWDALRARLATMPDADYESARKAAEAVLGKASPRVATRLVYAFPDEDVWSAALARTLLELQQPVAVSLLLASLSDANVVDAIVAAFDGSAIALETFAFDIADALGPRAESALLAIADDAVAHEWGMSPERESAFTALALVPSPAVAAWFAAHLDSKDVRAIASRYFRKVPDLAREALRPLTEGKKPNEVASALLRTIERAGQSYAGAEAAPSELPPVLAAPPWTTKRAGKKKPVVVALTPLPFKTVIVASDDDDEDPYRRNWKTLLGYPKARYAEIAEELERVISPRVAPVMAHVLTRVRKARRVAERWLTANPRAAAIQLLVDVTGTDKIARDNAARALRFLASRDKEAEVAAVAKEYGKEAESAVQNALTGDQSAPAKAPKLPEWLDLRSLPRPLVKGTPRALPLPALQALVEMLVFTNPEEPYEGIEQVREACDNLGELAWAIFESWAAVEYPAEDKWAFFAVGHFGTDAHAHRIAQMIRVWPTEGAFPRAVVGLDVLATMKSDTSFALLHSISEKVKSRPLLKRAREKMDSVAESLGLGTEELADRLVPTLGLDDDGSRLLDFGPRQFRVGFDEYLRPFVRDANGKKLSELPKVSASDDTEKANAATTEWKAIKKNAKTAAAAQLVRLENAMVAQRRWEPETFATYVARHPLVGHLARRLAFGAYDPGGKLLTAFRVAEDGTYADAQDETFTVPEGGTIGVLHPLEVAPETLTALGQRFSEYEILQPFPQVGREIPRDITSDDAKRFIPVDTLKLLALERRGWRRGPVGDGGMVSTLEKEVGTLRASLYIEPGIYAGDPKMNPSQTPAGLDIHSRRSKVAVTAPQRIFLAEVTADLRGVGALTSPP